MFASVPGLSLEYQLRISLTRLLMVRGTSALKMAATRIGWPAF
jgi:hypothetical protein